MGKKEKESKKEVKVEEVKVDLVKRPGGGVTVNNNSTAIKIFPAEVRATSGNGGTGEQNQGTKFGGIAWAVLDPHNGGWNGYNGHHCWMGMSMHSTPGQELSNWQVQMNQSGTAGSFATNVAIQASPNGYITKPCHPCFDVNRTAGAVSSTNADETWRSIFLFISPLPL